QGVFTEFSRPRRQAIEKGGILLQVALHQGSGQFDLARKVIEKTALGDMGTRHDVLDGGGGKAFLEDDGLRHPKDLFPPVFAPLGLHLGPCAVVHCTAGTVNTSPCPGKCQQVWGPSVNSLISNKK